MPYPSTEEMRLVGAHLMCWVVDAVADPTVLVQMSVALAELARIVVVL